MEEINTEKSLNKLDRIIFDYYFSLSSIAASKGQYNIASEHISELLRLKTESSIVFDLQAKIAAQQGKFREAEFLWKKCLNVEPDNHSYIAALHRLNKLQSSKAIRYSMVLKLTKVISIFLLLFFLFFIFIFDRIERKDQLALLTNKHNLFALRIDSLISSKETINELLLEISNRIKTINDISVHDNDKELTLFFNEGLFPGGIDIESNQIEILHQLSKVLSPFAGKITVRIVGSTDDIPITNNKLFKSNEELSLSRAKVVYDIINEASKIPREDLLIGSLSALNSFYPNDSPENRLKNRTAIIFITQK